MALPIRAPFIPHFKHNKYMAIISTILDNNEFLAITLKFSKPANAPDCAPFNVQKNRSRAPYRRLVERDVSPNCLFAIQSEQKIIRHETSIPNKIEKIHAIQYIL